MADDTGTHEISGAGPSFTSSMDTATTTRLQELAEDYTYRVNMLLDEDREDLAVKVADQYAAAVARALAAS